MDINNLLIQSFPSLIIAIGTGINLWLFMQNNYRQTHFEQKNMRFKILNEVHSSILNALISKNRFDTISMYKSLRKLSCLGNSQQIEASKKCVSYYNEGRNHFDYTKGEGNLIQLLSLMETDIKNSLNIINKMDDEN